MHRFKGLLRTSIIIDSNHICFCFIKATIKINLNNIFWIGYEENMKCVTIETFIST